MMLAYNLLQIIVLALCWPLLLLIALFLPKYRRQLSSRLGFGLQSLAQKVSARKSPGQPTIWVHALSVGEVTSARPLIKRIRATFPAAVIICSTTTLTGRQLAERTLYADADVFLALPFDFYPCIRKAIRDMAPDIFLLIETDFWPNLLALLHKRNIPCLLVNGRISHKSFAGYKKLRPLFSSLFSFFTILAMQTADDTEKIISLGVPREKTRSIGNLKFDAALPDEHSPSPQDTDFDKLKQEFFLPPSGEILVAGSTHPGEEKILLAVFSRLHAKHPGIFMVIAPRETARSREIVNTARRMGLFFRLRSERIDRSSSAEYSGLVLDSIGELRKLYRAADICFIGGSLVQAGGHNPLEPAALGKPVLFGPHMEDFSEIAHQLFAAGGANIIRSNDELFFRIKSLLEDETLRQRQGALALSVVKQHQGATQRCLEMMKDILTATAEADRDAP
jgi:3-deoxy-D-manno-octulosonic-acid transferase